MSRRPAIKCVITLTACANKAHRVAQPLESSAKVHELYFFVTLISAIENTSLGGLDGPRRERSHPVRLRLLQQQKLATAFTHENANLRPHFRRPADAEGASTAHRNVRGANMLPGWVLHLRVTLSPHFA